MNFTDTDESLILRKLHSEDPLINILQFINEIKPDETESSSDVIIYCSDGTVMAHQLILASISPVLCVEFRKNKFDEIISISLPEVDVSSVRNYLDSVYSCEDISDYEDFNNMLGFKFASMNTKPLPETIELPDLSELINSSMKEEMDGDHINPDSFITSFDLCKVDIEPDLKNSNDHENNITKNKESDIKSAHRSNKNMKRERKKRSKVWEHFFIDPDNPDQCICNICHGAVSYINGGTSSMMSHIKNDHVYLKVEPSCKQEPGLVRSRTEGSRKKRSKVWEYFSIDPSNNQRCICIICKEHVNYLNKGTSSMTSHLKCEHDIWVIKFSKKKKEPGAIKKERNTPKKEPVIDPETGEIKKSVECRAKRRKELWKHFEAFPEDNLKALCKICQQLIFITEKSSISQTLVKHLNTHDIKLELETCSVCGKTFEERAKRRKHEKNHQAKCSCSYCGKLFSDNTARILHERTHTGEKPFQVRNLFNSF